MSERKTAEIKFRCTPSFKSSLQASAEAADQTMSEYIESAVCGQQAVKNAIAGYVERTLATKTAEPPPTDPKEYISSPFTGTPVPVDDLLDEDDLAVIAEDGISAGQGGVFPDGASFLAFLESTDAACTCRPWEFCHHKASA